MSVAVKPEQIADVIRRTVEVQHELRLMRARLSEGAGPLAAVALASMDTVDREFEHAAEALKAAAPVVTLVTLD